MIDLIVSCRNEGPQHARGGGGVRDNEGAGRAGDVVQKRLHGPGRESGGGGGLPVASGGGEHSKTGGGGGEVRLLLLVVVLAAARYLAQRGGVGWGYLCARRRESKNHNSAGAKNILGACLLAWP